MYNQTVSSIGNCLHISVSYEFTGLSALKSDHSTSVRIQPFENDARIWTNEFIFPYMKNIWMSHYAYAVILLAEMSQICILLYKE